MCVCVELLTVDLGYAVIKHRLLLVLVLVVLGWECYYPLVWGGFGYTFNSPTTIPSFSLQGGGGWSAEIVFPWWWSYFYIQSSTIGTWNAFLCNGFTVNLLFPLVDCILIFSSSCRGLGLEVAKSIVTVLYLVLCSCVLITKARFVRLRLNKTIFRKICIYHKL